MGKRKPKRSGARRSPAAAGVELATQLRIRRTSRIADDLETISALDESELDDGWRLLRGLMIDTLCQRHPEVARAFNAWSEDDASTETADSVVIKAARSMGSTQELTIEKEMDK